MLLSKHDPLAGIPKPIHKFPIHTQRFTKIDTFVGYRGKVQSHHTI